MPLPRHLAHYDQLLDHLVEEFMGDVIAEAEAATTPTKTNGPRPQPGEREPLEVLADEIDRAHPAPL
jgi:hypothetical protein